MKTVSQETAEVTQNPKFLTEEQKTSLSEIYGIIESEAKIDIQALFDKVDRLCDKLDWTECILAGYLSGLCAGQGHEAMKLKRRAVYNIWLLLGDIYAACRKEM
jgi:hypothetical protein